MPSRLPVAFRIGYVLGSWRAHAIRAARVGPVVCLRLILCACAAVLALAGVAAFALVVLCVLLPVLVVVIAAGGLSLLAWPFAKKHPAPVVPGRIVHA